MRWLLALISLLVPRASRGRWIEEWRAELAHGRWTMVFGALPDAWALRRLSSSGGRNTRILHGLPDDLRYAVRSLIKSPAFALCVIGSLALGVAAMIAAFTFVNALMFRPFPGVTEQDRLVRITLTRSCGSPGCTVHTSTIEDYHALREGMTQSLDGLAAHASDAIAVTIGGRAHSVRAALVSENYFDVLGVRPALGRTFDRAGGPADSGVIIAHSLWLREFGGREDVLGEFVGLAGSGTAPIIGVAPTGFVGVQRSDIGLMGPGIEMWVPISGARGVFPRVKLESGALQDDERFFAYTGRLLRGKTEADARLETGLVAGRLEAARPGTRQGARTTVSGVWFINPYGGPAWSLFMAMLSVPSLVLLIACLNTANLLLARATHRSRELAVRLALGATRWRLVRQQLVESLQLALLAAAASVPLVLWPLAWVRTMVDLPMPLDQRVVAFATGLAIVSAVAFSLAPALRASAVRPGAGLGSSRPGDAGPGNARTRRVLVVAQVALSIGLLATGAQMITFLPAQMQSAGTPPDRLLMASFDVSQLHMPAPEGRALYRRLLDRVSTLPEADGAGLARKTAVWMFGQGMRGAALAVSLPEQKPGDGSLAVGGYAGGDLFRATGLQIVEGRAFTPEDERPIPSVAVINRPFAKKLFGGAAVGRTIRVGRWPRPASHAPFIDVTIVGVIDAALEPSFSDEPRPAIYLPSPLEEEPRLTLYVRARSSTEALAAAIRTAVADVDNRIPPIEMLTLAEISGQRQLLNRLAARGITGLGLVGLLLATAGLYAVMSYFVSLRSREIGVRLALGADPRAITRMTLAEALRLAAWGGAAGGIGAVITSKVVQSGMHGVEGLDPAALAGSFLLLGLTMLVASAVPAYRAARVDPITVLRQE
ncbi:MAG: ABC transporter permease [Vicinamibacterales bacterium]